jgi:hypothetical protein
MKRAQTLFLFVAVLVTIGACAAPRSDDVDENTDETSQAVCPAGTCDGPRPSPPVQGPTFACTGDAKLCLQPDNFYLSCNPANPAECVCIQGCGGGAWPFGAYHPCPSFAGRPGCGGGGWPSGQFNPCPYWAPRYACNPLGDCRCF